MLGHMNGHNPKQALLSAIDCVGGQPNLAKVLGIRQQSVSKWVRAGRAPATRVLAIEKATGGHITRHQLRPDLYPDEGEETNQAA